MNRLTTLFRRAAAWWREYSDWVNSVACHRP